MPIFLFWSFQLEKALNAYINQGINVSDLSYLPYLSYLSYRSYMSYTSFMSPMFISLFSWRRPWQLTSTKALTSPSSTSTLIRTIASTNRKNQTRVVFKRNWPKPNPIPNSNILPLQTWNFISKLSLIGKTRYQNRHRNKPISKPKILNFIWCEIKQRSLYQFILTR